MILSTTTFPYGRQHYALLGKLLLQQQPHVAYELISPYLSAEQPKEDDLSKIKDYFLLFCDIQNISPEDNVGPLYKSSKVDMRKVFIASMLHMYCPQVFTQHSQCQTLKRGIVTTLGKVLKQTKQGISIIIQEVIVWEKQYPHFSESVTAVIEQLKEKRHAA